MVSTPWVEALLAWYHREKREMPWRGHPNAYAVWISEIMLQQTQVDTVRPYFHRFLEAFPTIADLAAAADEPLLKAWEGLGYYTRVRNLRKAAQQLMATAEGQLPRTAEALKQLPGIGSYTAAAIASICFNEAVPVVDGNVARVFARRNLLTDDFSKEPNRR
ncbi:MAG: A/G-specific adenine glycosylase [Kiritimatiellae bacterium]|nr:A/G-specific adenine glycosylase [Kiritimatiellia bacterium]